MLDIPVLYEHDLRYYMTVFLIQNNHLQLNEYCMTLQIIGPVKYLPVSDCMYPKQFIEFDILVR